MNALGKSALIAGISSLIVFSVVFAKAYSYLSAHQPPHEINVPMPPNVTSYPPSAAWMPAFYWAVISFFGIFIILYVGIKIYESKRK